MMARQMESRRRSEKNQRIRWELWKAFRMFDTDYNGFISPDELLHLKKKLGERLTGQEIDDMISGADHDGDGQIDYEGIPFKMICVDWKQNILGTLF